MEKKRTVLYITVFVLFLLGPVRLMTAQHEGHGVDPASVEDSRARGKGEAMPCQRIAALVAELNQDFDALLSTSDHAELQKRLAGHKVKLGELRALTETCSKRCDQRPKRKGCGHAASH